MSFFKKDFTPSQIYGSGLALILILLLIHLFYENKAIIPAAVIITVLLMVWPVPFRYFATFWFGLAELLGYLVSRIVLTLIFLALVIPVGMLRRGRLHKSLKLNLFKKGNDSVFINRNHTYSADDFLKPF